MIDNRDGQSSAEPKEAHRVGQELGFHAQDGLHAWISEIKPLRKSNVLVQMFRVLDHFAALDDVQLLEVQHAQVHRHAGHKGGHVNLRSEEVKVVRGLKAHSGRVGRRRAEGVVDKVAVAVQQTHLAVIGVVLRVALQQAVALQPRVQAEEVLSVKDDKRVSRHLEHIVVARYSRLQTRLPRHPVEHIQYAIAVDRLLGQLLQLGVHVLHHLVGVLFLGVLVVL
mmetsp:Transcript_21498/g.40108  ORF Transcript_21498/g.40108 Transcript_21498/m.40108 type:complete len:224 (-) Transcript_21498:438-1109(-)